MSYPAPDFNAPSPLAGAQSEACARRWLEQQAMDLAIEADTCAEYGGRTREGWRDLRAQVRDVRYRAAFADVEMTDATRDLLTEAEAIATAEMGGACPTARIVFTVATGFAACVLFVAVAALLARALGWVDAR